MNNPDTDIFKINRENDIEEFSRYREKGISSIKNISKSKIPSRLGRHKVVAGNYKLSNIPTQFIKNPRKQFIKYSQRRPNEHNFPKLDNLIIDRPQYRRYFSYPYYYDYYYDPIYINQNLDNLPVINSINYYVPYEYIPAERYYKGEIRTKFAGEKDENDIVEAEEFNDDIFKVSTNVDIKNNSRIENFKKTKKTKETKENTFPFFIVLCIVVVIMFIIQPKPK
jgi:hypothetical protein